MRVFCSRKRGNSSNFKKPLQIFSVHIFHFDLGFYLMNFGFFWLGSWGVGKYWRRCLSSVIFKERLKTPLESAFSFTRWLKRDPPGWVWANAAEEFSIQFSKCNFSFLAWLWFAWKVLEKCLFSPPPVIMMGRAAHQLVFVTKYLWWGFTALMVVSLCHGKGDPVILLSPFSWEKKWRTGAGLRTVATIDCLLFLALWDLFRKDNTSRNSVPGSSGHWYGDGDGVEEEVPTHPRALSSPLCREECHPSSSGCPQRRTSVGGSSSFPPVWWPFHGTLI